MNPFQNPPETDPEELLKVTIPYCPREMQYYFHTNLKRFNVLVVYRSGGKTIFSINEIIYQAMQKPRGIYAFISPIQKQSKRNVWDEFKYYLAPIPGVKYNITELKITLPNDAVIHVLGADNADTLRGIHLDGLVLDEVAQMAPEVWTEVLRPTLSNKRGWAIFIGTKKGKDLFYDLYQHAEGREDWFRALVTADDYDTLPREELEDALAQMGPEAYAQEYGDQWDSAIKGAYYAAVLNQLEKNGQIKQLTWNPSLPVITSWDLGLLDKTCIWFAQIDKEGTIYIIDYYENDDEVLGHYAGVVLSKPYTYLYHIFPHDGAKRSFKDKETITDSAEALGLKVKQSDKMSIANGINAARMILPRCYFDGEKCEAGLKALRHYRTVWDPLKQMYLEAPKKDWSNHAADAFRYLAVEIKPPKGRKYGHLDVISSFDPFEYTPETANFEISRQGWEIIQ